MARAAVIPPASPPKRATRGRAKGTGTKTSTANASKQAGKVTKAALAADARRKNARTVTTTTTAAAAATEDSQSESESEETDDEIGVIDNMSRGKTGPGSRGKPANSSTATGRGRPKAMAMAMAVDMESESENDDDELAQWDVPKRRAGRKPKAAAKEGAAKATTTTSRPRGRPKGTKVKTTSRSEEDILKENTRRNALSGDSDELSSSQGPTEIFIKTSSAILRDPAKKKKTVTFQELSESDISESDEDINEPTLPTRRRRGTIVAKDQDGLGAKPVRKAPAASTRGRKPAAAKKGGAKPLSPKKATQVAKAISSYASSDGEDELNGEKDAIKLVVHSPQKHAVNTALNSPVRRINFTPSKPSKTLDENGEPNLPPPKAFDFGESQFMSSPARRPPPSPFHFTLKETPKRAGLSFQESARPVTRPGSPQTQNSPLRLSPKKANLGTPARGSLFLPDGNGVPAQPNFTPARDSPLKTSPKKGIFGTSFSSSQQPQQQAPTPFKTSLLMSPAKKVSTPFKSSINRAPSSLAKERRIQDDSDDETVSMYEPSPLRGQSMERPIDFEAEEDREEEISSDDYDIDTLPQEHPANAQSEYSEDEAAQSHPAESGEDEEYESSPEDEVAPLQVEDLAQDEGNLDDDIEDVDQAADESEVDDLHMPSATEDVEQQDHEPTLKDIYMEHLSQEEDQEDQEELELAAGLQEGPVAEESVRRTSTFKFTPFEGLEDVFTESPLKESAEKVNIMAEAEAVDDPTPSEDEELAELEMSTYREKYQKESTPLEAVDEDLVSSGPVQPYEVEEVADTPFINLLLTHWAPTLPLADVLEVPASPVVETETTSLDVQPETRDATPAESVHEPLSKHSTPILGKKETRSVPNRGPRFTLLAEQLSQWKASSPAKAEEIRPRRRGVFSLAGRRSDASSVTPRAVTTPRARGTDILANAPSLPRTTPRTRIFSAPIPVTSPEIDENEEEPVADENVELETPTREPMAEITHETPALAVFEEEIRDEPEQDKPTVDYPALVPEDDKENQIFSSPAPAPATPVESLPLSMQTFHTVSKVPLKPEGEISPLKICRKRGRSLSITSPVRSSPRLRNFVLPPPGQVVPDSPPRKSPRLQEGSVRRQTRESPSKPAEPQRPRSRTPSRPASPSKTPRKQVAAYNYCLRGAVVYVDVHTTEGEDASGLFVEALQEMGARCVKNWSWNPRASLSPEETVEPKESRVGITHVVFKDGGVRTLEKVRAAAGLVKCVGVGWVLDCESANKWLDETPYAVDSSIIPRGGAKRRKSMEPRALANVNGTLVKNNAPSISSTNRRQSEAARNASRSTTPVPHKNDRSTPETTTRKNEPDYKFWQTPRTPSAAALGFNMDSIGMSPATPFYLSQRSKLVQQTCPPKQTRQGLFSKSGFEDEATSQRLKAKLEAARRKSLAFKPAVGSPLVE
ncbi:hypothetical protein BJY01DRAFT_5844 [Aspergillus pseudoustus]|uniref:BRCT domain-containing protein n=1 Tax=Aspergillus pseudoustus TaxID=1810923 RepID=A0ABR4JQ65_9EURO